MNSAYTVHNSKICLPKSTNACKKKIKKNKTENVKQKTWTRYANGHYISCIFSVLILSSLPYLVFYIFVCVNTNFNILFFFFFISMCYTTLLCCTIFFFLDLRCSSKVKKKKIRDF